MPTRPEGFLPELARESWTRAGDPSMSSIRGIEQSVRVPRQEIPDTRYISGRRARFTPIFHAAIGRALVMLCARADLLIDCGRPRVSRRSFAVQTRLGIASLSDRRRPDIRSGR